MKKMYSLIVGSSLLLAVSVGFAAGKTDMDNKWTCTTNASSSDVDADKAADKQMSDTPASAAKAYAFAAQNCRDCTKITCEFDD